jgi:hypothetical protein
MGKLPAFREPTGWEYTEPKDIIITTDRSLLFCVGCHSWIIATETDDILLSGGPEDRLQNPMTSYTTEVGGWQGSGHYGLWLNQVIWQSNPLGLSVTTMRQFWQASQRAMLTSLQL